MGNLSSDRQVREYNRFCKKLKFIEGNEINVKVNQKFASRFSANFTLPPEYQGKIPQIKSKDEEILLVEERSFYPYPDGWCGGRTFCIYVFKATKKGNYKIKYDTCEINVTVN